MDGDEYGKIDAMKLQATKGTILSCIVNANMSDAETNENYILENAENNKSSQETKAEPTSDKACYDVSTKSKLIISPNN